MNFNHVCVFVVTLGTTFQVSLGIAGEAEKYHGTLLSQENPPSFVSSGGICLSANPYGGEPCAFGIGSGTWIASGGRKIIATWLERNTGVKDKDGNTIWKIEDSIEHSPNYKGTFDVETCKSATFSGQKIVAKGKWNWHELPRVGGYMKPVHKAWRIDFQSGKFIQISTKSVVCEQSENRD